MGKRHRDVFEQLRNDRFARVQQDRLWVCNTRIRQKIIKTISKLLCQFLHHLFLAFEFILGGFPQSRLIACKDKKIHCMWDIFPTLTLVLEHPSTCSCALFRSIAPNLSQVWATRERQTVNLKNKQEVHTSPARESAACAIWWVTLLSWKPRRRPS